MQVLRPACACSDRDSITLQIGQRRVELRPGRTAFAEAAHSITVVRLTRRLTKSERQHAFVCTLNPGKSPQQQPGQTNTKTQSSTLQQAADTTAHMRREKELPRSPDLQKFIDATLQRKVFNEYTYNERITHPMAEQKLRFKSDPPLPLVHAPRPTP